MLNGSLCRQTQDDGNQEERTTTIMTEKHQPHPKIPTYLVAVCSAFLVALFHLEYTGHFLVGYSFLVGLIAGGFGWLLAWGLWRFWIVFPCKRVFKLRVKVYLQD